MTAALCHPIKLRQFALSYCLRQPFGTTVALTARDQPRRFRLPEPAIRPNSFPSSAASALQVDANSKPVTRRSGTAWLDRFHGRAQTVSVRACLM